MTSATLTFDVLTRLGALAAAIRTVIRRKVPRAALDAEDGHERRQAGPQAEVIPDTKRPRARSSVARGLTPQLRNTRLQGYAAI